LICLLFILVNLYIWPYTFGVIYWLFCCMAIKTLKKIGLYVSHKKSFSTIRNLKADFDAVPMAVKLLILNMSLLRFGRWIGVNMFYSLFLKGLFDDIMLVSILVSWLAFVKLLFSVPIGILDDNLNSRKILIAGKVLFILAWLSYFGAWFFQIPWLVIVGILFWWIAGPMVFNTNQFLIRRLIPVKLASKTFGMFFSFYQTWYLIAALLTAWLVYLQLPIHYFFLIASGFSALTLLSNTKTKKIDKHGLFYEMRKEALQPIYYKKAIEHVWEHRNGLKMMLFMQAIHWLMYYLWFMFIPLLAVSKDFSLVQVALLFAVMRVPHALTVYLESFFGVKRELRVTLISFFVVAGLLIILALAKDFIVMFWIAFIMSFFIATTRPMISGMVTRLISTKEHAEITGIQEFMSRSGEIVGYMIFGVLSHYVGMEIWFIGISLWVIVFTFYVLGRQRTIIFNN